MSKKLSLPIRISLMVVLSSLFISGVLLLGKPVSVAQALGTAWTVTSSSDDANDGSVVSHTGSLRFALTHAISGDVIGFNLVGMDKIYAASTLTVPVGVAVGYTRDQVCGNYGQPRATVDAFSMSVDPVFSLSADSTLRNIDIGGGRISVRITGSNVDVCGSGLGIEYDGDGNLVPLPPSSLALAIDGDHAVIHRNYLNGPIAVSTNGSDSRLGDALNGSGDLDDGVRNASITVLADANSAAQRVTIRDPFPRALHNLSGNGVAGGDDVANHANNWAQTPTIISAYTTDNFSTVNVHGLASPLSFVDIFFDDQIAVIPQSPVVADATGVFTFTGSLPGGNVKVIAVSTLDDPAHPGRLGSSSQFSDPAQVTNGANVMVLHVAPAALTFNYTIGDALPPTQTLFVDVPPISPTLAWQTDITTTNGGAWLEAASSGTGSRAIGVGVNPLGLAAGTYHGTLTAIDSTQPADRASAAITLIVASPPPIRVSPAASVFTTTVNGPTPAAHYLTVATPFDNPLLTWQTTMTEADGAEWLHVSPIDNLGDGPITVTVSTTGLTAGLYHGVITVTDVLTPTDVATATVTLNVLNAIWLPLILN